MSNDIPALHWLREGRISREEYQVLVRLRFDNITDLLPREEIEPLLFALDEIDAMRAAHKRLYNGVS